MSGLKINAPKSETPAVNVANVANVAHGIAVAASRGPAAARLLQAACLIHAAAEAAGIDPAELAAALRSVSPAATRKAATGAANVALGLAEKIRA